MAIVLQGNLKKMRGVVSTPIQYYFRVGNQEILLNEALGKTITLTPSGNIYCIQCERKTKKSYQQGFCFLCLERLQECQMCVIHPERCLVEKGNCAADDWAHAHCHVPHIVYLANSSELKVGITRQSQAITRWIDQGACQAIALFNVPNRYRAGVVEVALKAFISDRTNWRRLLAGKAESVDLIQARDALLAEAANVIKPLEWAADEKFALQTLDYPVLTYPQKIKSLTIDNQEIVQGQLWGMKGQYLILDTGVINIRKFGGYEVIVSIG